MGPLEKKAVMNVMDSDNLSGFFGSPGKKWLGGPKIIEFEEKWAQKYGFRNAISVNSWTSGLIAAVGAIGIEPGDEVIVSPFTMSASVTCVLFYGGIPVFADVDEDTFNITANSIEKVVTKKTKAIIVVHLFGQPADLDEILLVAKKFKLRVIEDAAQAPGVQYRSRQVGSIGDIGGFSLNYHKHIHTGEGGMLVTNDDELALRCRLIRNHAENLVEDVGVKDLRNMVGFNFRLTEISAAIGVVQLDKLEASLDHRQKLAEYFSRGLRNIPGLSPPKIIDGVQHAYYLYPIKFDAKVVGMTRSSFVRKVNMELPKPECWEQTFLQEGYVKPIYLLPLFKEKIAIGGKGFPWSNDPSLKYFYKQGLCPNVERLHSDSLIVTPLIREPLEIQDIEDLLIAIRKVIVC